MRHGTGRDGQNIETKKIANRSTRSLEGSALGRDEEGEEKEERERKEKKK
jgi:hypothetical protein